jgi:outer membrane protein assembly factor BamB
LGPLFEPCQHQNPQTPYSLNPQGTLWFLNGASGNLLGNFTVELNAGSIGGGASIAQGKVFIGSGYGVFATANSGYPGKVYALRLPQV